MNYDEIVVYLKSKMNINPEIGIVLGSGLGMLAQKIKDPIIVPYSEIPYFPQSTVIGHKGQFIFGSLAGKSVVCMDGRFHYYEGYDLQQVTLPIRVMKKMGVSKLIVTYAAGGINADFVPGDLMLIRDHINLLGVNPLRGKNEEEFGERFPDMSEAYSKEFQALALETAAELKITLQQGIYVAMSGPSYETPAEIKYAKIIGADAVGMSTVPEVIVAVHAGMKVLGISCVTNMAAGISKQKLKHKEVVETANIVKEKFMNLVQKVVCKM